MPNAKVRKEFTYTKGKTSDIAPLANFQGAFVLLKGPPGPGAPGGRYTVVAYADKDAPGVSVLFDTDEAIVVDVEAGVQESDCQHALTVWKNEGGGGGGGGTKPPVWTGKP